jgi:hypothetical protein
LAWLSGLITGFYFERRATKNARSEATSLARQLTELREGIYTIGGSPPSADRVIRTAELDEAEVREWIRRHQNAAGLLSRQRLFEHFLGEGSSVAEVSNALARLAAATSIRIDNEWIEIL